MEKPAVHQAFLYFVPEKVRLCQFLLLVCQHMLHESSSFNYASFVIIVQEQVVTDFLFSPYFCCILLFTQFHLSRIDIRWRFLVKIFSCWGSTQGKNAVAAAAAEAAEDEVLAVFLKSDDILAKKAKFKVQF